MKDHVARGVYRGVFEATADDFDFQNLTPLAQAVFWTLKLKLGQYGIAVFYTSTLPEMHRQATARQINAALAELEAEKPRGGRGWIRREQNVVWIVNGLRYEPSLSLENGNHRKGALRFARTLPQLAIVREFIEFYGLESGSGVASQSHPDTHVMASGRGSRSHSNGIPGASSRPSNGTPIPRGITETDTDTETDTERETETKSGAGESESIDDPSPPFASAEPPAPLVELPPNAKRLLVELYGLPTVTEKRRADVTGQLYDTIDPRKRGGRLRGGVYAKARDAEHLDACCLAVLMDPPHNIDLAVRWVLLKLLDGPKESVTEKAADEERSRINDEETYHRAARAAGVKWSHSHSAEYEAIRARIDAQFADAGSGQFAKLAHDAALATETAKAAGFPKFETWLADRKQAMQRKHAGASP